MVAPLARLYPQPALSRRRLRLRLRAPSLRAGHPSPGEAPAGRMLERPRIRRKCVESGCWRVINASNGQQTSCKGRVYYTQRASLAARRVDSPARSGNARQRPRQRRISGLPCPRCFDHCRSRRSIARICCVLCRVSMAELGFGKIMGTPPKGFSRALSQDLQHSWKERRARGNDRRNARPGETEVAKYLKRARKEAGWVGGGPETNRSADTRPPRSLSRPGLQNLGGLGLEKLGGL